MRVDGEATRHRIEVAEASADRLDAYLAQRIPELSRSQLAVLFADGHVLLNGTTARKSWRPSAGDLIEVTVPAVRAADAQPESIPLEIVYQDEDLAVINKPAGLVVHPAPGHAGGTLVNALLHHIDDLSGIGGVLRPGIVHRLDKDTSGLMLIAKHDDAHRALSAALKRRDIVRIYTALAWGHLREDMVTIDAPIARAPTDRQRMAIVQGGRHARTHVHRLEQWEAADLLKCTLESGRTHQIRVHLAHIGHPVVGDPVYGGGGARGMSGPSLAWARGLERRVPRQFLHAAELSFEHPRTGEPFRFEAPLPADLAGAVAWARAGMDLG